MAEEPSEDYYWHTRSAQCWKRKKTKTLWTKPRRRTRDEGNSGTAEEPEWWMLDGDGVDVVELDLDWGIEWEWGGIFDAEKERVGEDVGCSEADQLHCKPS